MLFSKFIAPIQTLRGTASTHSMTSKDYKKIILDNMQVALKLRQFKKSGQLFKYSNGDLTYYIDLQSSKYSTATELTFTVNIGIGSELLYELEGKRITSHLRGHFTKRIGDYLLPPHDIWWTINNTETTNNAAKEIVDIISNKTLDEFQKIKSTKDLIDIWLTGMCFGLSDLQRQEYLALLYKSGHYV